jgi:hypothetical protein
MNTLTQPQLNQSYLDAGGEPLWEHPNWHGPKLARETLSDEAFSAALREAALADALIPLDPQSGRRPHSPLRALLPDSDPITPQVRHVVERITGRSLIPTEPQLLFARPLQTIPARARAALHRWAVKHHWDTTHAHDAT